MSAISPRSGDSPREHSTFQPAPEVFLEAAISRLQLSGAAKDREPHSLVPDPAVVASLYPPPPFRRPCPNNKDHIPVRKMCRGTNIASNLYRAYYICKPCSKIIGWHDMRGIAEGNPKCRCDPPVPARLGFSNKTDVKRLYWDCGSFDKDCGYREMANTEDDGKLGNGKQGAKGADEEKVNAGKQRSTTRRLVFDEDQCCLVGLEEWEAARKKEL